MSRLRWVYRQATGYVSNLWAYVSDFKLDDVLLPSVKDTANWILGLVPKALGLRSTTPGEQVNANIVFIAFWLTLSVLSLGATLPIAFVHLLLIVVAFWRMVPAAGDLWRRSRRKLPIKDDYDIPLWRSE